MLTYTDSWAKLLHSLPAMLALGLPLLAQASPYSTGGVGKAYGVLAVGTMRTLCSILLAVGLPALLGACRTLLSGDQGPPHRLIYSTHFHISSHTW